MKYLWPTFIVIGLLDPVHAPAQETPPKPSTAASKPIAWPPEFLRHLPPEYLERQHASLAAGTARMSRLRLSDTEPR